MSENFDEIQDINNRLRKVEDAILEISLLSKYAKYAVLALCFSLGIDVQGMV